MALATDWLCSAWDHNAQAYASSPAAAVVETVTARWLLEILGLPKTASVGFVTGGQMVNFTCLATARHALLAKGWDVVRGGLSRSPALAVLVGEEAHVTIRTALSFLGIGERQCTVLPSDTQGRIRADAVEAALETSGNAPVILCAQIGNVKTGASDAVGELSALARGHRNEWLHVDGAFGLWAAATSRLRPTGIEGADSWAVDGHKWLHVPYDSGIAIVAHADAHRAAMEARCGYVGDASAEIRDGMSWAPENSRRARALPIYAALRTLGRLGVAEMIERSCGQARLLAEQLSAHPAVQVLNDVVLNQVLFRVVLSTISAEHAEARMAADVQVDGTCWIGTGTWRGETVLRASVCNWSTSDEDIRRSATAILDAVERRSGCLGAPVRLIGRTGKLCLKALDP